MCGCRPQVEPWKATRPREQGATCVRRRIISGIPVRTCDVRACSGEEAHTSAKLATLDGATVGFPGLNHALDRYQYSRLAHLELPNNASSLQACVLPCHTVTALSRLTSG